MVHYVHRKKKIKRIAYRSLEWSIFPSSRMVLISSLYSSLGNPLAVQTIMAVRAIEVHVRPLNGPSRAYWFIAPYINVLPPIQEKNSFLGFQVLTLTGSNYLLIILSKCIRIYYVLEQKSQKYIRSSDTFHTRSDCLIDKVPCLATSRSWVQTPHTSQPWFLTWHQYWLV